MSELKAVSATSEQESGLAGAPEIERSVRGETPNIAAHGHSDERLGTILTDRVCTKCYFNLAGQPVVREKHYGLVVARCPECGTITAIQEYPHLTRWTRRFMAIVAMGWFVFLLFAMLISGAAVHSSGLELSQIAAEPGAVKLAEAHLAFQQARAALPGPQLQTTAQSNWWVSQPASAWSSIEQAFLDENPPERYFELAGGWSGVWNLRMFVSWAIAALGAVLVGICWAVALPHAKRWKRLLVVIPILGLATVFVLYRGSNGTSNSPWGGWNWNSGWQYATWAIQKRLYLPIALISVASMAVPLVLGVYIGRRVARLAVRMLVPPRLREPLYFLWFCDGFDPPRVRS